MRNILLSLLLWLFSKLINWIKESIFDLFDNSKSVFKNINLFSRQKNKGSNLVLVIILLTISKLDNFDEEYNTTMHPCEIDESNRDGINLFCLRNEFLQTKVFKFNPKVNCFI